MILRRSLPDPRIPSALAVGVCQYGLIDRHIKSLYWEKEYLLAKWTNSTCLSLTGDIKPHSIWYDMKKGNNKVSNFIDSSTPFGVQVTINTPVARISLSHTIKPLLDGIISSFHNHDGSNMDEIAERLSGLLKLSKEDTAALLANSTIAVLGRRRLLNPFGKGLQWNPADHMCVAAKVTVQIDNDWSISGEIFKVNGTLV